MYFGAKICTAIIFYLFVIITHQSMYENKLKYQKPLFSDHGSKVDIHVLSMTHWTSEQQATNTLSVSTVKEMQVEYKCILLEFIILSHLKQASRLIQDICTKIKSIRLI